jgi:hypothetical protein
MPTSLQFALSNPVAGQEEEFNRWYGTDHLIHGVLTPGVLAGQRFKRSAGPWPEGKHEYLMVWEMDDPALALAELAKARHGEKMPISPAIDMTTVKPPTMWRRATVRSAARIATDTGERKSLVLALMNAREGEDESFENALLGDRLAALADSSGVLCAEFLTLADEQIRGNARKYRFGVLIELLDQQRALTSLSGLLPSLPHLDPQRWLAPVFQPLGHRMSTAQAQSLNHG